MFNLAKPFFLQVITPMHVGSGSDLGIIDLPIQRERHTGFPKIESSGLKGCIREAFENSAMKGIKNGDRKNIIDEVFGPEDAGNDAHAGALGFTDARILLFPVKSMKGVYALVTCLSVITKFIEEVSLCKINYNRSSSPNKEQVSENIDFNLIEKTVSDDTHLLVNNKVILEEYMFESKKDENTQKFAKWLAEKTGIDEIKQKLVILPDDDFRDFVTISTEVNTRTKINPETGTVQTGALFTEEFLPAQTVLYSLALATKVFKKNGVDKFIDKYYKANDNALDKLEEEKIIMKFFTDNLPGHLQIGGDATLGKGIVKTKIMEVNNNVK